MILLDTNAVIAAISGRPPLVRTRLAATLAGGNAVATSSLVVFELWYGVARSQRQAENAARLQSFFAGPIATLAFDDDDAQAAATIRAQLAAAGTPIGPYDVLIAGQAHRHGATLVTANTREFKRVTGLRLQDWSRKGA